MSAIAAPVVPGTYNATLIGAEEVPSTGSTGVGTAIFWLSADNTTMHYKIAVAWTINITMSHIHLAPRGVNGAVVVWLYPSAPPAKLIPGVFGGLLAEGDVTAANLVGSLENQSLSSLLAQMDAGNTYVNVHTTEFPGGEIRGQITKS